ncbi:MAG: hypothetical protein ACI85H_001751 [Paracoccaceae bacterium]
MGLDFGGFHGDLESARGLCLICANGGVGLSPGIRTKTWPINFFLSASTSALIFKRLGFDLVDIKTKLDHAVFRAEKEGQAVVFGNTSVPTIAVLMEWHLQGGPNGAVLAPLSALFDQIQ